MYVRDVSHELFIIFNSFCKREMDNQIMTILKMDELENVKIII